MSKSHEYEVMTSVPPDARYPKEPFEWGLPDAVYVIELLQNLRYIGFQTGHFADFEQFKVNSHFAEFGQVEIDPYCLYLPTLSKSQL